MGFQQARWETRDRRMIAIFCNFFDLPSGATVWNLVVLPLKRSRVGWKIDSDAHHDWEGDGALHLGRPGSVNGDAKTQRRHPDPRSHLHARGTFKNQDARRDLTAIASFRAIEACLQRAGVGSSQRTVEGPFLPRCTSAAARDRIYLSSAAAARIRNDAWFGDDGQ